jgi:hypothetical protein
LHFVGHGHSAQRIVYILKNGDYPPRFYSGVTAGYSVQNFAP